MHEHTHRYTLDAREADSFMHAHDEFLILVAAGNARYLYMYFHIQISMPDSSWLPPAMRVRR